MNFCNKCGQKLSPEQKFCNQCGTARPLPKVKAEPTETPQVATAILTEKTDPIEAPQVVPSASTAKADLTKASTVVPTALDAKESPPTEDRANGRKPERRLVTVTAVIASLAVVAGGGFFAYRNSAAPTPAENVAAATTGQPPPAVAVPPTSANPPAPATATVTAPTATSAIPAKPQPHILSEKEIREYVDYINVDAENGNMPNSCAAGIRRLETEFLVLPAQSQLVAQRAWPALCKPKSAVSHDASRPAQPATTKAPATVQPTHTAVANASTSPMSAATKAVPTEPKKLRCGDVVGKGAGSLLNQTCERVGPETFLTCTNGKGLTFDNCKKVGNSTCGELAGFACTAPFGGG